MSKNAYIRVDTAAKECDFAVAVHCKNKKHVLGLLTKYRREREERRRIFEQDDSILKNLCSNS